MESNNKKNLTVAAAMTACLAVAGIGAYFTSTDTKTNNFTVGKVAVTLEEPNWNEANAKNITPNQTIKKDPQIKNTGVNDAFVFMTVEIPHKSVATAGADGTKKVAADTELFTLNGLSDEWKLVGQKQTVGDVVKYVYAYTGTGTNCAPLAATKTTPKLFESVTFANLVENAELEGKAQNINVKAYGIQTNNINGGKTAPADVWAVVSNQTK